MVAKIKGTSSRTGMIGLMTVIKINAITVPADSGDELARRFAARAGAVDNQDGFEALWEAVTGKTVQVTRPPRPGSRLIST